MFTNNKYILTNKRPLFLTIILVLNSFLIFFCCSITKAPSHLPSPIMEPNKYRDAVLSYSIKSSSSVAEAFIASNDILKSSRYSIEQVVDSAFNYIRWITKPKKDTISSKYWSAKILKIDLERVIKDKLSVTLNYHIQCAPVHDSGWTDCESYSTKEKAVEMDSFGSQGIANGNNLAAQIERLLNESK
jgi:hypothetical protein